MPKRSFRPRSAPPTEPAAPLPVPGPPGPPAWAVPPVRPDAPVADAGTAAVDPPDDEPAPAEREQATEAAPSRWRRAVRRPRGELRTPAAGRRAQLRQDLVVRAQRPLSGSHQVAVVALKGGVGKTTTAALLGLAMAEHRDDRIVALDSGPIGGTLADRLLGSTGTTIRDLLDGIETVGSAAELDRFTGLAGRLRVLGSDQDLAHDTSLNGIDYERVCLLLRRHFDVIVTDGATGMAHPAMAATLAFADSIVVVGSRTVDGAGRASKTFDWLIAHGHRDTAARAVLVLDGDRASGDVDAARLQAHFAARCRAVVEIPHDPHLAQGGVIDTAALQPGTVDAALELAALIADEFGVVTAGRARSRP